MRSVIVSSATELYGRRAAMLMSVPLLSVYPFIVLSAYRPSDLRKRTSVLREKLHTYVCMCV